MENYIFVLGRDKELSLLELVCYFNRKNIAYEIKDKWNNLVLVSLDKGFNIDELGGTIKAAKVLIKSDDKKELNNFFNNFEIPNKDKIYYSVNNDYVKEILSKRFKKEVIKAYFKSDVNDPSKSLKLDLDLIQFKDYIGKVIQVSKPKLYKKRDETRPSFDEKKVTSIRLSKILINLSQAKKEILDPFCGNGTILQEALLFNLDAYGLDMNINESRKNLTWLNNNFKIKNRYRLFQGDARNVSRFFNRVEVIVTEPYLGPYLKNYPNDAEAKKIIINLQELYKKTFQEFNKITNKVVIIFPVIPSKTRKKYNINVNSVILGTNFKIANYNVKLPILYGHKGSILEREIFIFEK